MLKSIFHDDDVIFDFTEWPQSVSEEVVPSYDVCK